MPPRDDTLNGEETSLNSPSPPKSPQTTTSRPRKRSPLSPLPILDRKHLLSAFPSISTKHIDAFYQQLHQQSYPPLPEFVQTYHRIENEKKSRSVNKNRKKQIQLPQSFLQFLQTSSQFSTLTSQINSVHHSADGTTTKLTVALQDGHLVETVIMRHKGRNTICVSSQVGCAMKCTFCATGTMGLSGNLCQGEILEQMVHAQRILDSDEEKKNIKNNNNNSKDRVIRNVVFMGMGEPLQNYNNVVESCRALMDRRRWNLAYGRVTVSTVGITANMRRLTEDLPEVNMALSLHAPNQELRETIVPTARSYKIDGLIEALDGHTRAGVGGKKKKAMIEYVMLEGPTSTFECAHQIGKLCENRPQIVVNLIPYNQTNVEDVLNCPSEKHTKEFQNIITSYGVLCYIRRTMGADIAGACGQLVVEKDIEDIMVQEQHQQQGDGRKGRKKKGMVLTRKSRSVEKKVVTFSDDNERWVRPLMMATALSGCCFVLSLGVWMVRSQAQRRR